MHIYILNPKTLNPKYVLLKALPWLWPDLESEVQGAVDVDGPN